MNRFILSLGSNLATESDYLIQAISRLREFSTVLKVSPLFENPPLLPANAPSNWYRFFFNTIVEVESDLNPDQFLYKTKSVEEALGRSSPREKWSPRTIDIDLIEAYTSQGPFEICTESLTLPHQSFHQRNFVLSPMAFLQNKWLKAHRAHPQPLSLFVAIFNVTPDSFSDTAQTHEEKLEQFKKLIARHPAIIDIGAESTRPGARPLSSDEEWSRLETFLNYWKQNSKNFPFTRLSLDTYHVETARRALDYNVSILNDVTGLQDPAMVEVAHHYEKVIFMHSLTVPADPKVVISEGASVIEELLKWVEQRQHDLSYLSEKLIFDPGLGFGKTALQSLQILQNIKAFHKLNLPLLIGHSRKSLFNLWSGSPFAERDLETLGASSELFGVVEYLRVHNLQAHERFIRSRLALRTPL